MNIFFLVSVIFFIFDFIIKCLVEHFLSYQTPVVLISHFFSLTRVHNFGAAWSILEGNRFFFIGIAFIFLVILYRTVKETHSSKIEYISYGVLAGGVVGNLWDRMVYGYVIDYLSFTFFGFSFPVFNLADTGIVLAFLFVIWNMMRGDSNA